MDRNAEIEIKRLRQAVHDATVLLAYLVNSGSDPDLVHVRGDYQDWLNKYPDLDPSLEVNWL